MKSIVYGVLLLCALSAFVPASAGDDFAIGGKVTIPKFPGLPAGPFDLEQSSKILHITPAPVGVIPDKDVRIVVQGNFNSGGGEAFLQPLSDVAGRSITAEGKPGALRNYTLLRFRPHGMAIQPIVPLTGTLRLTPEEAQKWAGIRVWSSSNCMELHWGSNETAIAPTAVTCAAALQ